MRGLFVQLTLLAAALWLSACQSTPSLSQAIITTPIDALPVSSSSRISPTAFPTPLPETIIAEADAEYLLLSNLYDRATPSVVNVEAQVLGNTAGTLEVSRGSGFVYEIGRAHV